MFRDHPPEEKGPVVRQCIQTATRDLRFIRGPLAVAFLLISGLGAVPAIAQDPGANPAPETTEPMPDATRRTTGINWNPLTTVEKARQLDRTRIRDLDPLLRNPSLSESDRKTILNHLETQVYSLTLEQNVDQHPAIIEKIVRPLELNSTSQTAKDFLSENILRLADTLLKDQPANVMYSAVLLAARLNSKQADLGKGAPPQPYLPAQKLLTRVLSDPLMPISCRIMATRGLDRMLRDGDTPIVDRSVIGTALGEALKQTVEDPIARNWYRFKLVEALGVVGRWDETGKRPVVIDALMSVIVNPQDEWEVRCAAARSVTQLPLDNVTNVELVNYEIVKLAHDLAVAYNAAKDKTPASKWRWAFSQLYFCYNSAKTSDQKLRHWGLLHLNNVTRGSGQVQSAYKPVLALVKPFVETTDLRPVEAAKVKALADWLAANPVTDRKPTPLSAALP